MDDPISRRCLLCPRESSARMSWIVVPSEDRGRLRVYPPIDVYPAAFSITCHEQILLGTTRRSYKTLWMRIDNIRSINMLWGSKQELIVTTPGPENAPLSHHLRYLEESHAHPVDVSGGSLHHRISPPRRETSSSVVQHHVRHVRRRHLQAPHLALAREDFHPVPVLGVAEHDQGHPPGRRASYIVLEAATASSGRQMTSAARTTSAAGGRPRPSSPDDGSPPPPSARDDADPPHPPAPVVPPSPAIHLPRRQSPDCS